jgi:hypothetical protein
MPNAGPGAKRVGFDFPLKGYDENFAAGGQRKGTSRAQLNCLPYDVVQKRARGGQRPGISKLLATQLASGSAIDGLLQVTLGQAAAGGSTIFNELWSTYADAPDPEDDVNVDSVNALASATWEAKKSAGAADLYFDALYSATADGNVWIRYENYNVAGTFYWSVEANDGSAGLSDSDGSGANALHDGRTPWAVRRKTGTALGSDYTLSARVAALHFGTFNISVRLDSAFTAGAGVTMQIAGNSVVKLFEGSTEVASFDNTDDSWFDPDADDQLLELVVTGNDFACKINGVSYLTHTSTHDAGNTRVAFGASYPAAGSYTNFDVKQFELVTAATDVVARDVRLIATGGGEVWTGTPAAMAQLTTGLNTTNRPSLTDVNGDVYLVNGVETKKIDVRAGTIANLTAAVGKGEVPAGCRLACTWRGRLVLAAPDDNPQNAFLSRALDPTDWLYGQDDATSAVELNASEAGRIGQPIVALVPFQDDVLVIGCDHSLYALQGDPAASDGQLVTLSEEIGMLSNQAWCFDPSGILYFVGTGGLFKMAGGGSAPVPISASRFNEFFASIDRSRFTITLQYERDRHQVWIFITKNSTGQSTHLVYDARTDGFWRQRFPDAHGPTASVVFDGDGPTDRVLILGSRDGYLRKLDLAALDDDGDGISSFCMIGPVQPQGDFDEFMLQQFEVIPAVGTTGLQIFVMRGADPEAAASATQELLGTYTAGGRQRSFSRFRANSFYLYLANNGSGATWAIENIVALGSPAGIVR